MSIKSIALSIYPDSSINIDSNSVYIDCVKVDKKLQCTICNQFKGNFSQVNIIKVKGTKYKIIKHNCRICQSCYKIKGEDGNPLPESKIIHPECPKCQICKQGYIDFYNGGSYTNFENDEFTFDNESYHKKCYYREKCDSPLCNGENPYEDLRMTKYCNYIHQQCSTCLICNKQGSRENKIFLFYGLQGLPHASSLHLSCAENLKIYLGRFYSECDYFSQSRED